MIQLTKPIPHKNIELKISQLHLKKNNMQLWQITYKNKKHKKAIKKRNISLKIKLGLPKLKKNYICLKAICL